jgi:hypothetical protein
VVFVDDTPLRRETCELQGDNLDKVTMFSTFHAFYLSTEPRDSREVGGSNASNPTFFSIIPIEKDNVSGT